MLFGKINMELAMWLETLLWKQHCVRKYGHTQDNLEKGIWKLHCVWKNVDIIKTVFGKMITNMQTTVCLGKWSYYLQSLLSVKWLYKQQCVWKHGRRQCFGDLHCVEHTDYVNNTMCRNMVI